MLKTNTIGISSTRLILATALSFILVLIPILLWTLWVYCVNSQSNQEASVKMYHSYFPEFMNGRYTMSLIMVLLKFSWDNSFII
jgi:hypothetical protein